MIFQLELSLYSNATNNTFIFFVLQVAENACKHSVMTYVFHVILL